MMRLNPKYIDYFVEKYWDKGRAFDWRTPYDNIYVGLRHLKNLMSVPGRNIWQSIICYNAGGRWLLLGDNPPGRSIEYANLVFSLWLKGALTVKRLYKSGGGKNDEWECSCD
jgi:hypothetical protein